MALRCQREAFARKQALAFALERSELERRALDARMKLLQACLDVTHLRMPDRLQFTIDVDGAVLALHCPAAALLALVDNAIRQGTDPAEEGAAST